VRSDNSSSTQGDNQVIKKSAYPDQKAFVSAEIWRLLIVEDMLFVSQAVHLVKSDMKYLLVEFVVCVIEIFVILVAGDIVDEQH
jgi:hypothetical protein